MTSFSIDSPSRAPALARLREASPLLWNVSLAFLAAFVICVALVFVDHRQFNGISVWVKPAKFYLSLAVHMLTLSVGVMLLPRAVQESRSTSIATGTMAAMAIFEMAYITFRAARGEASHFNTSSDLAVMLYNLMGIGAALMMVVTAWLGIQVLRHGRRNPMSLATGTGFLMAAILTLAVGFTLGGMGSHWIGGDQTDATGLPLFGWSTTGGDLRVSHFVGLHLAQGLPILALSGSRVMVLIGALAGLVLTLATFAQALMGLPLIAL